MAKPQGSCIFCGARGLTKEHFWPDWCEPLFPKTDNDERVEISFTRAGPYNQPTEPPLRRNRPGRVITKKLRVVCKRCNNTWMSGVETSAKPVLLSMFYGNTGVIDEAQQTSLANWIALKVMISEFSKPNDYVTSVASRYLFRETRTIPQGFHIRIGMCGEDRWRSSHFRQAGTYGRPGNLPQRTPPRNTQTVTIGFGYLLVHAFVQPSDMDLFDIGSGAGYFSPLWPLTGKLLSWPPAHKLSLRQADGIAQSLDHVNRSGHVGWRPWPTEST
jgi:hypothetical protein